MRVFLRFSGLNAGKSGVVDHRIFDELLPCVSDALVSHRQILEVCGTKPIRQLVDPLEEGGSPCHALACQLSQWLSPGHAIFHMFCPDPLHSAAPIRCSAAAVDPPNRRSAAPIRCSAAPNCLCAALVPCFAAPRRLYAGPVLS